MSTKRPRQARELPPELASLPLLLTPDEVGTLLRRSRAAVYAAAAQGQIPGARKVVGRLLFHRDPVIALVRAPSPTKGDG